MALEDYLVPIQTRTNICFDCQKALGGCSWSALDPVTHKPKFEPVPGWTAKKSSLNGYSGYSNGCKRRYPIHTYHITKCPEFVPDAPRKIK